MSGWGDGPWGGGGWGGGGVSGGPFRNLGFEITDGAGGAAQWTLAAVSSVFEGATFTESGSAETFEVGWTNDAFAFALVSPVEAIYDTGIVLPSGQPIEDFEHGWGNDGYLTVSSDYAVADWVGGLHADGFEAGWGNDAYERVFIPADVTVAAYANGPPQNFEPFERQWRSNESFMLTFSGGVTHMNFGGIRGAQLEDFEFVKADTVYTTNFGVSSSEILATAHGLLVNYQLVFNTPNTGGAMPAGLQDGAVYWVKTVPNADSFTVALSMGGPMETFADNGRGLLSFAETAEFWSLVLP